MHLQQKITWFRLCIGAEEIMNKLYLYNGMLYCEDCMKELKDCNTAPKLVRTSLSCSICDYPYSEKYESNQPFKNLYDDLEFDN
jgi:hypothetical protein